MLCDAFRRLSEIRLVETYRYIGFGSYYFVDFSLFHKALNINSMFSIEKGAARNKTILERYEANKPYKCIEIIPGQSHVELPKLDWTENSIIWLDYDGGISSDVLADIQTVCANSPHGNVLVITLRVEPGPEIEEDEYGVAKNRLERLEELLGKDKIPFQIIESYDDGVPKLSPIKPKHLDSWGTAKVLREIVTNEIESTLVSRNSGIRKDLTLSYKQLFNFHYADGVKMLTVGGILFEDGQSHKVSSCAFERFPFISFDEKPYKIDIPFLTYRELRKLDSQLPNDDIEELKKVLPGVPEKDILSYLKIYRYFPTFAETEL